MYWILDENQNPVKASREQYVAWAKDNHPATIALNDLDWGIRVSTVFLGIDHGYYISGPPVLYETMVLGSDEIEWCERHITREQALESHCRALAVIDAYLEYESIKRLKLHLEAEQENILRDRFKSRGRRLINWRKDDEQ